MTINDYKDVFLGEVRRQLSGTDAARARSVLATMEPHAVFLELERLREAGRLRGAEFEKALSDFYWLFCH